MITPPIHREISALPQDGDRDDIALRPQSLDECIGQPKLRENIKVFIQSAKNRNEALDHTLFFGPPGLGKTTLAQIMSKELGVGFKSTSGPVIARAGDLAALLTNLQPNDVLFIDEIHRLNPAVEEILYPAMEDGQLDIMIGEGPAARSVKIDLPPFTLVAATTRSGLLTTPLRDRFGIHQRLEFYDADDLAIIVKRLSGLLGIAIDERGAHEIAKRSRGTPRVAGRLTRRVRDFASVAGASTITAEIADHALGRLEIDQAGLDSMDHRYLRCIIDKYAGGPVGVDTLCAALSEQRDVIEDVVEPYLLQQGLLQRTPRGRMISDFGYSYLGVAPPSARASSSDDLFL